MTIAKEKERLKAGTVKVLLVEDNEVDAKWVARSLEILKDSKFQLVWVTTVKDGLEKLCEETYDVVILDLKLPDGFGMEVFDTFYKAVPHLPIIPLTGNLEEETLAIEAIQKGAEDYLFKGKLSSEGLIRALTHSLERHKLLALKDNFVNIVSHELRTPLSGLRESVALVAEELMGPVSEQQKEFLKLMLSAIERMERTSSGLLDLAKMEAGKSALHQEDFDMVQLAKEIRGQFEAQAHKKSLVLNLDVPGDSSVIICADRDKIARVLINLLSNALKFTETGAVEIAVRDLGDTVESSVKDTGKGIGLGDLPKVFSKFEQFGTKGRGKNQGSGLGLSICREIINLHRGTILVESELGKGSRFAFRIPKEIN